MRSSGVGSFSIQAHRLMSTRNMTDSPGVRTRRQAAAEGKQVVEKPTMNGHANGSANPGRSAAKNETSENIFLFYPNIIGLQHLHLKNLGLTG